nr:F-box protein At1g67340 [Ipomoea batatas]
MDLSVERRVVKRRKSRAAAAAGGGGGGERSSGRKRPRLSTDDVGKADYFDSLPDDIVLSILSKLSSNADCPADFMTVLITCKRLNGLGFHPLVLSAASQKMLAVKAENWSESAHRFLKLCADAGNFEACYILGMIRFYCYRNRGSGASLMAKAAINSHAPALYSLAVMQFNGSGGSKTDKDLRAGVALCARAASVGHVDALRELGHCFQDGYGVKRNVPEGRRFLVQANVREVANVLATTPSAVLHGGSWLAWNPLQHHMGGGTSCPLLSDFGCNVPSPEPHPANKFLTDWFKSKGGIPGPGLRLCSNVGCGRPELRRHEFRRCSVCGSVNYCSRACQAMHWRSVHKSECVPAERWPDAALEIPAADVMVNGNGEEIGM